MSFENTKSFTTISVYLCEFLSLKNAPFSSLCAVWKFYFGGALTAVSVATAERVVLVYYDDSSRPASKSYR